MATEPWTTQEFRDWMARMDLDFASVGATLQITHRTARYWADGTRAVSFIGTVACEAVEAGLTPAIRVESPGSGRPKGSKGATKNA